MSPDEVRHMISEFVRDRNALHELPRVDDDLPLIGEGYVDSLGLLDLVAHLEERTGRELDLLEIDPEELLTPKGLLRHFADR
jgi:acyl carrier protein